jgi:hypothetical protein
MFEAVERTAKDEECPFFADQFDRRRKRAPKRRGLECLDIRFDPDNLVTIQSLTSPDRLYARLNAK